MVFGFADLPAMLPAVNEGKGPRLSHQAVERRLLVEQRANAVAKFWLARELEYERRLLRDLMAESPDGIYFKDRNCDSCAPTRRSVVPSVAGTLKSTALPEWRRVRVSSGAQCSNLVDASQGLVNGSTIRT